MATNLPEREINKIVRKEGKMDTKKHSKKEAESDSWKIAIKSERECRANKRASEKGGR